jgi:hypothetical protein
MMAMIITMMKITTVILMMIKSMLMMRRRRRRWRVKVMTIMIRMQYHLHGDCDATAPVRLARGLLRGR